MENNDGFDSKKDQQDSTAPIELPEELKAQDISEDIDNPNLEEDVNENVDTASIDTSNAGSADDGDGSDDDGTDINELIKRQKREDKLKQQLYDSQVDFASAKDDSEGPELPNLKIRMQTAFQNKKSSDNAFSKFIPNISNPFANVGEKIENSLIKLNHILKKVKIKIAFLDAIENKSKAEETLDDALKITGISSNKKKRFGLTDVLQNLFSNESREFIHKAFIISTMIAIAYVTGKMGAQLLMGKSFTFKSISADIVLPQKLTGKEFQEIKIADLFRVKVIPKKKKKTGPLQDVKIDTNIICKEAKQPTSLPIKMGNSIVLQDSLKSIVSVQVRNKKNLKELREGDKIENLAHIGKIDRLKIIIKNLKNGKCEYIISKSKMMKDRYKSKLKVYSPSEGKKIIDSKKPEGISNDGNNFKICKELINDKIKNISSILTQARGIPINNPDGTMSFKIVDIVPGSIFAHLGMINSDIITNIDGKKINNINEIMNMFGRIKDLDRLQLSFKRNDSAQTLEYTFNKCPTYKKKK